MFTGLSRAAAKRTTGRGGKPLSRRSAACWIAEGIAKAGLQEAATGTGVKGTASQACATAEPATGCRAA